MRGVALATICIPDGKRLSWWCTSCLKRRKWWLSKETFESWLFPVKKNETLNISDSTNQTFTRKPYVETHTGRASWRLVLFSTWRYLANLFRSQIFQLILNSMHKYQPRVHIIRKRDHTASVINLKSEEMKTFTFAETNFIGVTAYQNQLVSSEVFGPSDFFLIN